MRRNIFCKVIGSCLSAVLIGSLLLGLPGYAEPVFAAEADQTETEVQDDANKTPEELAAEKQARIQAAIEEARAMPAQSDSYESWPEGPVNASAGAILMDMDTGAILYEKNIEERYYPASITKIMTALVAVENGGPQQEVVFSHDAVYSIEPGSASAGMKEGEKITLDVCLRLMMSQSANECANAVAETVGGDKNTFINMMNDKAAELGCVNTHFTNPHGLFDEDHYTCTYDMALIARAAYQNEWFRDFCNLTTYNRPLTELNPTDDWCITNRHQMLRSSTDYYYEGVTGGKTGFTEEARNTLVTFAERDDMRLVCVVMKTEGVQVYASTKALFDYGFEQFAHVSTEQLYTDSMLESIRSGVGATVPKGQESDITTQFRIGVEGISDEWHVNAATLSYTCHGNSVGTAEINITAREAARLWKEKEAPPEAEKIDTGEDAASSENGNEAEGRSEKHWNVPFLILAGVFIVALIVLLVAVISLSVMRHNRKKKKQKNAESTELEDKK